VLVLAELSCVATVVLLVTDEVDSTERLTSSSFSKAAKGLEVLSVAYELSAVRFVVKDCLAIDVTFELVWSLAVHTTLL
jgi:hypothetical protein